MVKAQNTSWESWGYTFETTLEWKKLNQNVESGKLPVVDIPVIYLASKFRNPKVLFLPNFKPPKLEKRAFHKAKFLSGFGPLRPKAKLKGFLWYRDAPWPLIFLPLLLWAYQSYWLYAVYFRHHFWLNLKAVSSSFAGQLSSKVLQMLDFGSKHFCAGSWFV